MYSQTVYIFLFVVIAALFVLIIYYSKQDAAKESKPLSPDMQPRKVEFVNLDGVKAVAKAGFSVNCLDIELITDWNEQDRQPEVAWSAIKAVAVNIFTETPNQSISDIEGDDISITTYSPEGKYRFESKTQFGILPQIAGGSMSFEEWLIAANADFR